ncbi:hypothetical protein GFY24_08200 [Nocardia sp. SYP-A9097]|uniref:hypothetical protein n=1 Tax=Nocardia sp. SYP-A9097 TaxID=2663237 RepID=UPI00129B42D4|nr:hypothetical protein [Nocardia sp. SYP-A9097]MRH87438.1 hypothetical protein [Nocardia sp. SYP-A9097]
MAQRLLVGLGAAALIAAATGALAPAANAADLAEGVSCDDRSCRNDTDDIYRVQARVRCTGTVGPHEISIFLDSHSTQHVSASCPDEWPGTGGIMNWNDVKGIDYLSATIDNSSRRAAPSGS